jgi:hypothetical protein
VLVALACLFGVLGSLVLIAWVGRKWGATNTVRGAAPWLAVVGGVSMTVASLAFVAVTLQTYGWAGTLCTITCLVWLADFAAKRGTWLCKRLRERGRARAADRGPAVTAAIRAAWRPGRLPADAQPVTARVAGPADAGRLD